MTDENNKITKTDVVIDPKRTIVDVDEDLGVRGLWAEMGRMTGAINEMHDSGNMVHLDHAAMELAQLWHLLDKRRQVTTEDLIFRNPSDQFQKGMEDLLGVDGETPQLGDEEKTTYVSDVLPVGERYTCPECGGVREIPGVGVYGKVEGLYLPSRGHNESVDDLVCPNCGFVVAHHYASKTFWEKSAFEPQGIFLEKEQAADSVEHHIWEKIESLEAHIKAVEASVPVMIQESLKKHVEDSLEEELVTYINKKDAEIILSWYKRWADTEGTFTEEEELAEKIAKHFGIEGF